MEILTNSLDAFTDYATMRAYNAYQQWAFFHDRLDFDWWSLHEMVEDRINANLDKIQNELDDVCDCDPEGTLDTYNELCNDVLKFGDSNYLEENHRLMEYFNQLAAKDNQAALQYCFLLQSQQLNI